MESATVVIKVKYGDTLRRFNALVVDQELDLNTDGLRGKILSLFNFAPDTELTLTYTDEDGDVVALVDDEDLRDVVRQALNPLRITVKLSDEKSSRPYAQPSGSSTPLRSLDVPPPFRVLNSKVSETLKSVPEPVRDTLTKLSIELASKAPGFSELVDAFSKMGLSCISQLSESQTCPVSSSQGGVPERTTCPTKTKDADCSKVASATCKDFSTTSGEQSPKLKPEAVGKNAGMMLGSASGKEVNKPSVSYNGPKLPYCGPILINECPFAGIPIRDGSTVPWQSRPHAVPFKRGNSQSDSTVRVFHRAIHCDGCGVHPITGSRFKSKVKEDYDLCSICFAEMGNETDYIRMDRPEAYWHPFSFKGLNYPHEYAPTIPQSLRGSKVKPGGPIKLDSHFIQDVNVLDGTVLDPLTPFTKIWRMRNNGTVVWPHKTKLIWVGGDKLSDTYSVEVEVPTAGLAIDQELDVAIDFVAPELPGRYISYWRMASPSGHQFGQCVWVLIQVDVSVKEQFDESGCDLNLNLPPVSSVLTDPEIIDLNAVVSAHHEPDNSNKAVELGQLVVNVQPNIEQEVNFPINDSLLVGGGVLSSTPLAPPSCGIIDLHEAVPALPQLAPVSVVPFPSPTAVANALASTQRVEEKIGVEEKLLRELEEMGFKQVDLNKEVLRTNEYDLEQSLDDLCGVSEWDPILEELQEMGFCDEETNKQLLKKNKGSIKRVVMNLIAGEK